MTAIALGQGSQLLLDPVRFGDEIIGLQSFCSESLEGGAALVEQSCTFSLL